MDAIVERVRVEPGMAILVVLGGRGRGVSAVASAVARAVGPEGHVTTIGRDADPDLRAIVAAEARRRGLTNLTVRAADARALPFPDGTFDRVVAAWGSVVDRDGPPACRERLRVLKPGGRAVYLGWGAPAGTLSAALTAVGFIGVEEDQATVRGAAEEDPAAAPTVAVIASGIRPKRWPGTARLASYPSPTARRARDDA